MPGYLLSPGTLCAAPPTALLGLRTPQPEPATPEPAGGCPNSWGSPGASHWRWSAREGEESGRLAHPWPMIRWTGTLSLRPPVLSGSEPWAPVHCWPRRQPLGWAGRSPLQLEMRQGRMGCLPSVPQEGLCSGSLNISVKADHGWTNFPVVGSGTQWAHASQAQHNLFHIDRRMMLGSRDLRSLGKERGTRNQTGHTLTRVPCEVCLCQWPPSRETQRRDTWAPEAES